MEVPTATIVKPIIVWLIPSNSAVITAPRTKISAPMTTPKIPTIDKKDAFNADKLICSSLLIYTFLFSALAS